jgi:hypothetical protein
MKNEPELLNPVFLSLPSTLEPLKPCFSPQKIRVRFAETHVFAPFSPTEFPHRLIAPVVAVYDRRLAAP